MNPKVIVALDYSDEESLMAFVNRVSPELCGLKVGKELFTACGPASVEILVKRGFSVFLDLKYHDIPNTVHRACSAAKDLGVWMINVHALGGAEMIQAAKVGLGVNTDRPLLTAVTILTSMDHAALTSIGFEHSATSLVERLARLSESSGADGVVCSANEVGMLSTIFGREFLKVTPGIRPGGVTNDDQKRIMSPSQAVRVGADYLVIGRPITQSEDPVRALEVILKEVQGEE